MNANVYPTAYPQQSSSQQSPQQMQLGPSGGAINPALLATFQQNQPQSKFSQYGGGSINPAQILNGMGNMSHGPQQHMQGAINPAQLLQQQQHQTMMNGAGGLGMGLGHGGMNNLFGSGAGIGNAMGSANNSMTMDIGNVGGANIGIGMGGMGGINPAALSGGSHPGGNSMNAAMLGMSSNSSLQGAQGMNPSAMMLNAMNPGMNAGFNQINMNPANLPNHMNTSAMSTNMNPATMLATLGMTREQFSSLSNQEKQVLWQKAVYIHQQQQQQQQQQSQLQSLAQGGQQMGGQIQPGMNPNLGGSLMGMASQSQAREQYQQQQNQEMLQGLLGRAMASSSSNVAAGSVNTNASGGLGSTPFYDRPSSSASTSSHSQHPRVDTGVAQASSQHQMMPPPPPRPPTAQSQGHHSRPGTSLSHHSPTAGMQPPLPTQRPPSRTQQQPLQLQRPPSRAQQFQVNQPQPGQRPPSRSQPQHHQMFGAGGMINGYAGKPLSNQQQHGHSGMLSGSGAPGSVQSSQFQALPHQTQMTQSGSSQQIQQSSTAGSPSPSTAVPGSPLRGAKRKLEMEASPRLASGFQGGNVMGPPIVPPKSLQSEGLTQVGQPSSVGNMVVNPMIGMNPSVNVNGTIYQSPRPGSAGGAPSGIHNVMDVNMTSGNTGIDSTTSGNISSFSKGLGMGSEMSPIGGRGSQPPQQMPQQRQSSIPPQFPPVPSQTPPSSVPLVQQHMRQSPIPPVGMITSSPVKNELRSSVPPPSIIPVANSNVISSVPPLAPGTPSGVVTATAANQAPPLPPGVNPVVTHISYVPLADSTNEIAELTDDEIRDVQHWMKVDKEHEAVWKKMKERMAKEAQDVFGPRNAPWWERGSLDMNINRWRKGREGFDIRYPRKPKDSIQRRKGVRREGLKLPQKLSPEEACKPEQLVPIRLEFDVEHHKMRDTFIWNLNDPIVTPEHFAQTLVEDYNLAPSYHATITKSIQDQLSDFKAHSVNYDVDEGDQRVVDLDGVSEDVVMKGRLDDESNAWWESWRKRLRTESFKTEHPSKPQKRRKAKDAAASIRSTKDMKDRPMSVDDFEFDEQTLHEEMRILIRLDIIVGSMKLDDQFEWDLDNPNASPEEFAEIYAQDLGLGGEFKTAIAHSIREQVQAYQKSLFLVGHPSDGSAVQDEDLRLAFLPTLTSGARSIDQLQSYTPLLNYLSDGEIERSEKEREKDMTKRRKRNTRGRRGIALPDREPIRTYRTPAIGFPELDPATLALAAAANAPSRRAAAAAASLTIANMVASENGIPFMPQTLPSAPQPPVLQIPKEKKAKGFFKAPSYASSVLRPRAQVSAPTPSTAADVTKLPAPLENDPPPAIPAPTENKVAKVISAKRAKELEREAKEKEYVDGQHPNYIDGVWHCSNCGCPESIAIGRRKGPLGDKSQCGTCGKYWHRHRRPRPVEYTSDPDFHSGLRREAELVKSASKKKGAAAALRAQSMALSVTPADASEPQTPSRSNGDVEMTSRRQSPLPSVAPVEDDRAISPVSTASSTSEPPLSQKVKTNGTSHTKTSTPVLSAATAPVTPSVQDSPSLKTLTGTPPSSPSKAWPPQWLTGALQAMRAKYPKDRFELTTRKGAASATPEWRVKCLDCPGKLYTPGPGETLSNYEVHLKNRQHRQRVNERLNNGTTTSTS
ncbi:hypothetical protein AMATHDRAFT_1089 [Amanita thiersii Skay4041]|uniref:SNF5-domain-containing protein n=1 Tax=Amanita thiersii Skay4041 TaxID=703135 RepID=A0A2A9NZI6_9AGAR|nr:hypothetical protein AMATHDRAFT_1089 [Amanita thiersii Skay4041]